jgi:peroxiredoxin (alkyl hydroperoxide reductase subunit C)
VVRLVEALKFTKEYGEVYPAGWKKGDQGMKSTAEGVAFYLAENSSKLYSPSPGTLP